jgi:hypothetical protein
VRKPVTVRRSKTDGRSTLRLISYDVCHDGVVLAKIQKDNKTDGWFWYGMRGPSANTATNPREFLVVKAEAVARCKEFVQAAVVSPMEGK